MLLMKTISIATSLTLGEQAIYKPPYCATSIFFIMVTMQTLKEKKIQNCNFVFPVEIKINWWPT